jgi:hypothetical protein
VRKYGAKFAEKIRKSHVKEQVANRGRREQLTLMTYKYHRNGVFQGMRVMKRRGTFTPKTSSSSSSSIITTPRKPEILRRMKHSIHDMMLEMGKFAGHMERIEGDPLKKLSFYTATSSRDLVLDYHAKPCVERGVPWPASIMESMGKMLDQLAFKRNVILELHELYLRAILNLRDCMSVGEDTPLDINIDTEGLEGHRFADPKDIEVIYNMSRSCFGSFAEYAPCAGERCCTQETCKPSSFPPDFAYRSQLTGAILVSTGVVSVCKWTGKIHICVQGLCDERRFNADKDGSSCAVSGIHDEAPLLMSIEEETDKESYRGILARAESHAFHRSSYHYDVDDQKRAWRLS